MVDSLISDIENFDYNNVWVTRKSRINAEKRWLKINLHIQIILNWYSVSMLSLSVLTLVKENRDLDILNTMVSIILLGVTLVITLLKPEEMAEEYKKSYIDISDISNRLNALIFKLKTDGKSEDVNKYQEEFIRIKTEYNNSLRESKNHSEIDYYKLLIETNKSNKKIYFLYRFKITIYWLIYLLVLILPLYLIVSGYIK